LNALDHHVAPSLYLAKFPIETAVAEFDPVGRPWVATGRTSGKIDTRTCRSNLVRGEEETIAVMSTSRPQSGHGIEMKMHTEAAWASIELMEDEGSSGQKLTKFLRSWIPDLNY
jgi:hypothetical protein